MPYDITYMWNLKYGTGVLAVVQGDCWRFESPGMQVRSLAWHSGLRIWHCHGCGLGLNGGLDLIPDPGTPQAAGWPKKKKQKKGTNEPDYKTETDSHRYTDMENRFVVAKGEAVGWTGSLGLVDTNYQIQNG